MAERRKTGGFTLAEILAAMLLMAIVIPVALQGMMIANRAGVVAERRQMAARLADNLLTELVLTEDWRDADDEGDFGEDWPGYRWALETDAWDEDTMRTVCVRVMFDVQGRESTVQTCTLVSEVEE